MLRGGRKNGKGEGGGEGEIKKRKGKKGETFCKWLIAKSSKEFSYERVSPEEISPYLWIKS